MKLLALKVYFFLATSCPISQQYTAYIRQFTIAAKEKNIEVVLVFPKDKSHNRNEVNAFKEEYRLNAPAIIDRHSKLAAAMHASVTPEVFLTNERNEVLYHGAIDNWYYALGKSRIDITEHYLEDAISSALNNRSVVVPYVKPVGCFLPEKEMH